MRVALVNPPWSFHGSIYFGCREPHLPLELGYADALLRQTGHETLLLDCHLCDRSVESACDDIENFGPEITVVTTAPTYLFWRCAPPELRVPAQFLQVLGQRGGRTVAVGPHGSVTPNITLRKLGVDAVVHLAALCNDPLGDLDAELTHEVNYRASVQLAHLAKQAGVRRFLFSSSCSLYGVAGGDNRLGEDAAFNPITAYGASKVCVERDVARLADESFSPTFLRNATAYGCSPRMRLDIVLNKLACPPWTGGEVKLPGTSPLTRPA